MTELYEIQIDGEIDENNDYPWLEQPSYPSTNLPPASSSLAFRSNHQQYNNLHQQNKNEHHIIPITEEDYEDAPSEHEIQIVTDDITTTNIGEPDIMQNYITEIEFEEVKEKKFKKKFKSPQPLSYRAYPPHITLVHWIRENCVNPFVDSFYQQMRADALQVGISVIPLLPIWNYLTFGLYKVSKPCQELPIEFFTAPKIAPKRPFWKKIYSTEGFFIVTLTLCLITQLCDRDDDSAMKPKKQLSNRKQKYVGI